MSSRTRQASGPDPEGVATLPHHPIRHVLLTLMDDEDRHTLAELARAVGWPRSTVARHLKALAAAGLVTEHTERKRGAPDQEFYRKVIAGAERPSGTRGPSHGRPHHPLAVDAADDLDLDLDLDLEVTMSPEQAVDFWARVEELALQCSTTQSAQLVTVRVIAHVSAQRPPSAADSAEADPSSGST